MAVAAVPVTVASLALAGAMGFIAVAVATAGVRCAVRVARATCSAMGRSANAAILCASFTAVRHKKGHELHGRGHTLPHHNP